MATDLLSSIGITTPKGPDPAALTNQREVLAQLDSVKGDLKGTMDSINLALSAADLLGVDASYTNQLTDLKTQAETLTNSTSLPPDQLEKKKKDLDEKLTKLQAEQAASIDKRKLDEAQAAIDAVESRYKELQNDKTISPQLLAKYKDLLETAKTSKESLKKTIETAAAAARAVMTAPKKEGFQVSPTSSTPLPTPVTITMMMPAQIMAALEALNFQKEAEEDKTFNLRRLLNRVGRQYARFMAYTLCIVGAIIGGIVLANHFVDESFWGIKLYYFVYGAAFFPGSLLFGVFKPPLWHATVAPLFKRDTVEAQTMFQRWFTYETQTVAAEDLRLSSGRTTLRILCGGVAAGLAGFATYFRFDTYLKKGG